MVRNHLVVLCVALSLGAVARAEEVVAARAEPSTAVHLIVGASALSTAPVVVGAGIGWFGAPVPATGLELERALSAHWSLLVGASGELSRGTSGSFSAGGVSVEPGLRWYAGSSRFSGGFVSATVPLSWSSQHSDSFDLGLFAAGASVLLGWSFRTDGGLTASLGAGPTLRVARTWLVAGDTQAVSTSGALALRGVASVGFAF